MYQSCGQVRTNHGRKFCRISFDICRIRHNEELNRLMNGEDIVQFIKAQRIRRLGHVKRMEMGTVPRRMLEGRLFIEISKGRPR